MKPEQDSVTSCWQLAQCLLWPKCALRAIDATPAGHRYVVRMRGNKVAAAVLLDTYEAEARDADRLIEELTRDTERATQLQGCQDDLARLGRQLTETARDQNDIAERSEATLLRWHAKLRAQGLPLLVPAALREWQAQLADAREQSATCDRCLTSKIPCVRPNANS